VRQHKERAFVALQCDVQRVDRLELEAFLGFVEHQYIGFLHHYLAEKQKCCLAAGRNLRHYV